MSAKLQLAIVLVAALSLVSSAQAKPAVKLQGEYQLAGRLDDKGSPTAGTSHLYLSLTGDAARTLYQSLAGDPAEDVCTGYKNKAQGNVGCYEIVPDKEYFCSFSVNLERGVVEAGLGGCV